MARDTVYIGSTPCNEDCAQVGAPDYEIRAKEECRRFIALLRDTFGPEPEGARLRIKSNPHDFGYYYEVVCDFDPYNEAAAEYAYRCESDAPETWA